MQPAPAPLVTVVTPVWNGVSTIRRCLESVKSQVGVTIEHVVIDGASTDGTVDLLKDSGARVVSEKDGGIYDAMSKGVRLATGTFVHILNADDAYARPDVLSRLVSELQENRLDLVHGRVRLERSDGSLVRVLGKPATFAQLLRKCRVAHPSVVVRRDVYERFGAFSTEFRIAGDYEFLLRVWPKLRVGFVDEIVTVMQLGGASTRPGQAEKSNAEAMRAALKHGASPVAARLRMHWENAKFRLFFARSFTDRAS